MVEGWIAATHYGGASFLSKFDTEKHPFIGTILKS